MTRPSFFVIIEDSPFTSCKKESPNHWAFFLLSVFHWRVNLFHQGSVEQAGTVQHRLDLLLTEALLQQHEDIILDESHIAGCFQQLIQRRPRVIRENAVLLRLEKTVIAAVPPAQTLVEVGGIEPAHLQPSVRADA